MPRTTNQIKTGSKPVAYTDFIFDDTSVEPSRGNQLSNDNQSPCQINTGRKPVAYTDSIFDDTTVEPSRGNQFPPVVQPRYDLLWNFGTISIYMNY